MKQNIIPVLLVCTSALLSRAQDLTKDLPKRTYSSVIQTNITILHPEENTNKVWMPPVVDGHRDRALAATRLKHHFREIVVSNIVETTELNGELSTAVIKSTALSTNYYEYHLQVVKTDEPPRDR